MSTTQHALVLAGNIRMPAIGFGTFLVPPESAASAVKDAIAAGYRHIDTADPRHAFERTQDLLAAVPARFRATISSWVRLAPAAKNSLIRASR